MPPADERTGKACDEASVPGVIGLGNSRDGVARVSIA